METPRLELELSLFLNCLPLRLCEFLIVLFNFLSVFPFFVGNFCLLISSFSYSVCTLATWKKVIHWIFNRYNIRNHCCSIGWIASFRNGTTKFDQRNSIHTCNRILCLSVLDYVRLLLMTLIERMWCFVPPVMLMWIECGDWIESNRMCAGFFLVSVPFAHLNATFNFVLANHPCVCMFLVR